jgi:putative membrane protein insertion efficiency factor
VTIRIRPLLAAALLCAVAGGLLGCDLSRPPDRQVATRAAVSAIRWYQATLSRRLGARCRFTPSCSEYALAVIRRHGAVRGGWLTAKRLIRCGPWTAMGTVDIPE